MIQQGEKHMARILPVAVAFWCILASGSLAHAGPMEDLEGTFPTYEECMEVFGSYDFDYRMANKDCRQIVRNLKKYCLNNPWERGCGGTGAPPTFSNPSQNRSSVDDRRQQQRERAEFYRLQRRDRLREEERQRQEDRVACRKNWIARGGTPGVCPGINALTNKRHPCHC